MPEILTYKESEQFNSKILLQESRTLIKSHAYNQLNFQRSQKNVFLSYSSKDSSHIPFIIKVLTGHGGKPYLDKGDERLPKTPSAETARVLKEAIIDCPKLVVFVTTNTKDSRWIPWELGIGEGTKKNEAIALFPVAERATETSWLEQEYLGLYRRIVWGKLQGYPKELWMVYNHKTDTATRLVDWF